MTLPWPILLIVSPNGGIQVMSLSTDAVCSSCKQLGVLMDLIASGVVVSDDMSAAVEIFQSSHHL